MERKTWVRPQAKIEKFLPNEYVAACGINTSNKYIFKCDAPGGTLWADLDRNGSYSNSEKLGSYHPCSKTHVTDGPGNYYNGFVDYNGNNKLDAGEEVLVWVEWWGSYVSDAHASKSLTNSTIETVRS